jgi:hypothetical protein
MNKYHGGKIYALRSPSTDKIYIGSTTQLLYKRKAEHKNRQKNEISKLDDFYIELLENFKCENKEELNKREGELIRENDKCINKNIAGRNKVEYMKEYYKLNKETINKKNAEYYELNTEKILKQNIEYRNKKKNEII